jgi:hypothetical protein
MSKLCSELHMPVKKTKSCKTAKVCRALKNDVVNCEQYIFKIHFHTCGHHISQVRKNNLLALSARRDNFFHILNAR